MTIKARLEMKNGSQIWHINRPGQRHGHKYSKYKMYIIMVMGTC